VPSWEERDGSAVRQFFGSGRAQGAIYYCMVIIVQEA